MKNCEDIFILLHSLNKNACLNIYKNLREGNIKRVDDEILQQPVIEINAEDFQRNFITLDNTANSKGIHFLQNYLNIHIKNIHKSVQITIVYVDQSNKNKEISMSSHAIKCKLQGDKAQIPLRLEKGWNFLQIDLNDLSQKVFQIGFKTIQSISLHSNCRISCVYISQFKYKQKNVHLSKVILRSLLEQNVQTANVDIQYKF